MNIEHRSYGGFHLIDMLPPLSAAAGGLETDLMRQLSHSETQGRLVATRYFCDSSKIRNMRAVIQRVSRASVTINGQVQAAIEQGLLIFLGIEDADTPDDIRWLCGKIVQLRIFDDQAGVMNESVLDIGGDIIVVSQFTLHASTKKGNRPSYIRASKPDVAIPRYEAFIAQLSADLGKPVATGVFGADMKVELLNDGPVTILIDTRNRE
ncbi:MAG: hypothetical protein RJA57_1490 [Bacteroidota bacterium]